MLYVFHVDAGLMTTYDMSLTLESVASLKLAIEKKTKISSNLLVLLVSGGEVLQSDEMVSAYSAGTDTNPIYMFSKPSMKDGNLKQSTQYSVCGLTPIVEISTGTEWRSDLRAGVEVKSVEELKIDVEKCCALPPSVSTVVTCASLAQQFSECAHAVAQCCDQLVHDQHLQHQGWAAVVANLEDIFNEFCERSKNFKESFKKHKLKKEHYHQHLILNEVLESLGKIPILPALKMNAEAHRFSAFDIFEGANFEGYYDQMTAPLDHYSDNKNYPDFDFKLSEEDVFREGVQKSDTEIATGQSPQPTHSIQESEEDVSFKANSYGSKEDPTLLHWILAQGNKASLQDILDYCQKGLSLIDADPLKDREAELCHILEYANMHGLKQLKGIEDRLFGLDQLLNDVRKLEKDQRDQAVSLIQNKDRVTSSCDPSVLPILVQSHRCQLEKLLKNHQTLVDIRRRIAKSKDELSHILKARLEAVLRIENSMSIQDAHQMLSFQCFNRLARYFDIVEQLHHAPAMFVRAVHEVARRRTFSDAFLQWVTELSGQLLKMHEEEVARRQEFNTLFNGHFLKSLFPGMGDLPPAFATATPAVFDERLPKLTNIDVEYVSTIFPELTIDVPKYNMEEPVKFFSQRLGVTEKQDIALDVPGDLEKGFDSETETGEFEKLSSQEKSRVDVSTICLPETNTISTITEDNMDTHKHSLESLRDFLLKFHELCKNNIYFLKNQLILLRKEIENQKEHFRNKCEELTNTYKEVSENMEQKYGEEIQKLTVDHEVDLSEMKSKMDAVIAAKEEAIQGLKKEKDALEIEHRKVLKEVENERKINVEIVEKNQEEAKTWEAKIEEAIAAKHNEIKELRDRLHAEYKTELDSLRSRFRLVALTNMDRSPSESSLEKIERTDVIEINNHNAIIMQTKENAEVEKEEAVKAALAKSEEEWKQKLTNEINVLKTQFENERQVTLNEVSRRLIGEKDRQLELLRERETHLVRECFKYKETIQQLTDPETNYDSQLKTTIETLKSEKAALEQRLQDLMEDLTMKSAEGEKPKEDDSEERREEAKELKKRPRSHTPSGLSAGTLSLSSCLAGHTVLVLWDPVHLNYIVMQEASIMYFVHSDCLPALDLQITVNNEQDRRLYAIAVVESKEYCYAKKSGNRYHMPRGSRFYRVRVKPSRTHHTQQVPPCCDHKNKQGNITENSTLSNCINYASL